MEKIEVWKVIDFANIYQVSNLGRVKNTITNHILTLHDRGNGYLTAELKPNGAKKYNYFYVHRLVAEAFIPNPLNKSDVNHKDFNPSNNCVNNLEWATRSENMLWSSERIRESAKKKTITDKMRQSYMQAQIKKSKNPYPTYIYKDSCGFRYKYRVKGKKIVDKHFKTLDQAITFKNNYVAKMNEKGELELL